MYEKKYFPFWNFVKTNKYIWRSKWPYFKRIMLSARGTKPGKSGKVNSKWHGWSPRFTLKAGEGDCDGSSSPCAPGLKCGHNKTNLPGVKNTGAMGRGRDFCYDPNGGGINDSIIFLNGSTFDEIIPSTTSIADARRQGFFYSSSGVKYLDKNIYLHENFPFWLFLRTASVN